MEYAIDGVTVINVESGCAIPGQTVLIKDDCIVRIGAQGEVAIQQDMEVIPGQGLYLMPGLVDAHVHYFDSPIFGWLMLANGVLLVRDMGMPTAHILELRDQLNRGEILGPEMIATGAILDGNLTVFPLITIGIRTPEEGRAAVRQQVEAGVDMIKVYSSLKKENFLAIADEAQKLGHKLVGHVPEEIYIEDAVAAGLCSSEHFFGFEKVIAKLLGEPFHLAYAGMGAEADYFLRLGEVDPEDLQLVYRRLQANGLTICPTLVVCKVGTQMEAMKKGNLPGSKFITPAILTIWSSMWSSHSNLPDFIWKNWAQMVVGLHRAGVPLMIGTDLMVPGILPGFSVHEEMSLWQEAGIPPADVLRSATIVPARFMGLGERCGTVEEGKQASLLILRGNPLEDVRQAQEIEAVFLRGQYLRRIELDRLLDRAEKLAWDERAG